MKSFKKICLSVVICLMSYLLILNNSINAQVFESMQSSRNNFQSSIFQVTPFQFGSFFTGSFGGTVEISPSGIRSSTGSVVLLYNNEIVSPAVFEIKAPNNTMIQVNFPKHTMLKTQSSAGNIKLILGDLSTGNVFITPNDAENGFLVSMGGHFEVGNQSQHKPGSYSGNFSITIIVE